MRSGNFHCANVSMAGSKTLPSKGRIQMSQTNYLQIVTSGLQRTAGPYRSAKNGHLRISLLKSKVIKSVETVRYSTDPSSSRGSSNLSGSTKCDRRLSADIRRRPGACHSKFRSCGLIAATRATSFCPIFFNHKFGRPPLGRRVLPITAAIFNRIACSVKRCMRAPGLVPSLPGPLSSGRRWRPRTRLP